MKTALISAFIVVVTFTAQAAVIGHFTGSYRVNYKRGVQQSITCQYEQPTVGYYSATFKGASSCPANLKFY